VLAADARLRNRDDFTATVRRGRRVARGALVVHVAVPHSVDQTRVDQTPVDQTPVDQARAVDQTPAGRAADNSTAVDLMNPDPVHADGTTPARAGFVVSKEVGGAVVRNQVKRRLRHLIRPHLDRLPAGTDVVVRALPAAATKTYADLQVDLDAALSAALRSDRTRAKERGGR